MVTYDDLSPVIDRLVKNDLMLIAIITVGLVLTTSLTAYHDTEGHVLAPKHDHDMTHKHMDDGGSGRMRTGTPSYLSGIGGWY